ncbi:MAG TPA: VOC family protein [Trebonia sp.]|nr:VOC family protein [Trebonia sp.]
MTTGPEALIDRIVLIVSDLDQAEDDYVRTLGCSVEGRDDVEPALARVLRIPGAHGRRSRLRLGRERIELLEFTGWLGRSYPPDSTSTDLWFQHVAIVVTDMTDAHRQIMADRRFRPISRRGPVQLPESSGGVTAFKFRDYDGHPLELLALPEEGVSQEWPDADGPFAGLDHTAIAVTDTMRGTEFFSSVFGFSVGSCTENRGPEQADLDAVDDVQVSVTRVAPDQPVPRLELLHYHVGTRRPIPVDVASNDIAATHSVVQVASLDATAEALRRRGTPLGDNDPTILDGGIRAVRISGPDGHLFLVEERAAATLSVPSRPFLNSAPSRCRVRFCGRTRCGVSMAKLRWLWPTFRGGVSRRAGRACAGDRVWPARTLSAIL